MSLALRSNLSAPSLSFPVLPVPRFLPLQLLSPYHTPFHTPLLYLCLSRCSFLALLSYKPFTQDQVAGVKGGLREKEREREPESALSASLLDGVVSRESSRVTVVTGGVTSLHRRLLCHQLQS